VERLVPYRAGLASRGLDVELVALPRGRAERAVPVYRQAIEPMEPGAVIGGQSFGGRVASLVAATTPPAGLLLLSYPLHAPGREEAWEERTDHWPSISCPVLLLSGESDPFARIDLLRAAVERLPIAELVTFPGVGHGLQAVLPEVLGRIGAFCRGRT
jgi:hypothetical protein